MKLPTPRLFAATALACLLAGLLGTAGAAPAAADVVTPPVGGAKLASTGIVVDASPGTKPLPKLSAASYLLADATTGEVLAAKNPHGKLRPASTLKILTAVTLLPQLSADSVYTAKWEDANVEGSKVGIVPNGTYTVHNLFEGMFLMSGNDAANSLANAAGGVPQTVAAMNAKAKELGALDTHVVNPSGLDADGQVTSAYDLALFARAGLDRVDFRGYAGTVKSQFPGKMPAAGKPRPTFEIYTQNKLVRGYDGAIGVKTGWTTLARGTFVGAATRGGRTLVATVMHTGPKAWKESAALLDWGFANGGRVTPVGTLVRPEAPAAPAPAQTEPPAKAPQKAALAGGGTLPWWAWVLLGVVAVVGSLRARVLVRRRRRRYSLPPLERDRVNAAPATAPATAPTTIPRQPRLPRGEPVAAAAPAGTLTWSEGATTDTGSVDAASPVLRPAPSAPSSPGSSE
ncbi:MAG: D-alanyl-D-alanine carboxypeptidase family protein [Nocardioidaceae bacterium]